jgi:hypothetical protein
MTVTKGRDGTSDDRARADREATTDETLAACRHYWEVSGIDPADIRDMGDELRGHLDTAVARGRRVQDVVGPDVTAFAIEWAKARTSRRQRWRRLILDGVYALTLLALFGHMVLRTTELPIRPSYLIWPVALFVMMILWRPAGRAPGGLRVYVVSALIAVPATLLFGRLFGNDQLFYLPLWLTGPLGVLAVVRLAWDARRRPAAKQ